MNTLSAAPPINHPEVKRRVEPAGMPTEGEIAATKPDFVDVSHHQENIDWPTYAATGRKLAVCKVTEGGDFVDSAGAANRAAIGQAGLKCGLYHFARPKSDDMVTEANLEANFYLSTVSPLSKDEFPVLDFEVINGLKPDQLNTWAKTWCATVEKQTGKAPWIYTDKKILNMLDPKELSKYPLWLANYQSCDREHPPDVTPWPSLTAWQYTDKAPFPGIGKADGSYLYGAV